MTFEEALNKLNDIREKLEDENITLEESMKLYAESVDYTKLCLDELSKTEGKISVIKAEIDKLVEKPLNVSEE